MPFSKLTFPNYFERNKADTYLVTEVRNLFIYWILVNFLYYTYYLIIIYITSLNLFSILFEWLIFIWPDSYDILEYTTGCVFPLLLIIYCFSGLSAYCQAALLLTYVVAPRYEVTLGCTHGISSTCWVSLHQTSYSYDSGSFNNTCQQNLTFFFGTRGKWCNPNRTFNAEFKCVSRFSPSPTVCLWEPS